MKGKLPWTTAKHNFDILQLKIYLDLDSLCEGFPEKFKEIIKYAKKLELTEEPDYSYLKDLLIKAGEKNKIDINNVTYDWDIKSETMNKMQSTDK